MLADLLSKAKFFIRDEYKKKKKIGSHKYKVPSP